MINQNQNKTKFTPLTYILIGVVLALAYIFFTSKTSPNDCRVGTGQYIRVFAGPGINYDVMTILSEGDRLTLTSGKSTDYHIWQEIVTSTGIKGWAEENWKSVCQ